jgi:hypothetical protein
VQLIIQDEAGIQLERYLAYLEQIGPRLPAGARSFALASWHYDIRDRKCPHDSWLESTSIQEIGYGTRKEVRNLQITATFLGSFHDGVFDISYEDVKSYSLALPSNDRRPGVVHGDWLVDEVLLTEDGYVSHEILFSDSAVWKIVCRDMIHQWRDPVKAQD